MSKIQTFISNFQFTFINTSFFLLGKELIVITTFLFRRKDLTQCILLIYPNFLGCSLRYLTLSTIHSPVKNPIILNKNSPDSFHTPKTRLGALHLCF